MGGNGKQADAGGSKRSLFVIANGEESLGSLPTHASSLSRPCRNHTASGKVQPAAVPRAGKKAGSEGLREAIFELRDAGHDVQVRVTYESSDTERYVKVELA